MKLTVKEKEIFETIKKESEELKRTFKCTTLNEYKEYKRKIRYIVDKNTYFFVQKGLNPNFVIKMYENCSKYNDKRNEKLLQTVTAYENELFANVNSYEVHSGVKFYCYNEISKYINSIKDVLIEELPKFELNDPKEYVADLIIKGKENLKEKEEKIVPQLQEVQPKYNDIKSKGENITLKELDEYYEEVNNIVNRYIQGFNEKDKKEALDKLRKDCPDLVKLYEEKTKALQNENIERAWSFYRKIKGLKYSEYRAYFTIDNKILDSKTFYQKRDAYISEIENMPIKEAVKYTEFYKFKKDIYNFTTLKALDEQQPEN